MTILHCTTTYYTLHILHFEKLNLNHIEIMKSKELLKYASYRGHLTENEASIRYTEDVELSHHGDTQGHTLTSSTI